ncbi:ABC transporter ATP-binding protein [Methylobacterium aerolatum]|uniref:ABC-2 type transport system ATP-binding protein n=1 Tax=Methylobacterium aerolatum TaxID=418708 RepID=A0ABU0HUZ6_9HYPH|nr:ABC transporter ATP-binding protein [Methylobacterium aerolatum]MDQ0446153.1 ABC-2 type transport system ATP-binding protein [Methylobacterium aerolatum]GJD35495.1 Linearmycin resistance ATP-binding protein LnrL [Methylobacterium aerolatum]
MPPVAVLTNVALSLRGRRVLDGIDLILEAGETLALLGPNGAGKTSLMRLVAGRLGPEAGTVRVGGADPHRAGAARRAVGWVPQEIALYPRLTVAENLSVFAQLAGLPRRERRAAVDRALGLADIEAVAHRVVMTLSGGYQRRVNIAAGLIGQPALVLLDEPTNGVDLAARAAIHAVLHRLREQGTAILIATHDFPEAERLADRVAFLAQGRIVREGRLADLLARLRTGPPERELILDAAPDAAAEQVLRRAGFASAGVSGLRWRTSERAGLDGAALLGTLRAQGVPVGEVRVRSPRLETLYVEALRPRDVGEAEVRPLVASGQRP